MARHLICTALLLASTASHADNNCETIRAQIDTKVRSTGAKDFVLAIVDADAKVAGKVVGSCDLGSRKIVYAASAAASTAKNKPTPERILTECKDGTVTTGDCKK